MSPQNHEKYRIWPPKTHVIYHKNLWKCRFWAAHGSWMFRPFWGPDFLTIHSLPCKGEFPFPFREFGRYKWPRIVGLTWNWLCLALVQFTYDIISHKNQLSMWVSNIPFPWIRPWEAISKTVPKVPPHLRCARRSLWTSESEGLDSDGFPGSNQFV